MRTSTVVTPLTLATGWLVLTLTPVALPEHVPGSLAPAGITPLHAQAAPPAQPAPKPPGPQPQPPLEEIPRIVGLTTVPPYRMAELRAEGIPSTADFVLWDVSPEDKIHATERDKDLWFTAPPGEYMVKLRILARGKPAMCLRARVVFESPCPPVPPPVPPIPPPIPPIPGYFDPVKSTLRVRIYVDGKRWGGCTAVFVWPPLPDGRAEILCAAHCFGNGIQGKGTVTTKDGKQFSVKVVSHDKASDLCWLVTDQPVAGVYWSKLAREAPQKSAAVWHNGYGEDRPGNIEEGTFTGGPYPNGQFSFNLSVSRGDSGGPIFLKSSNEILASVCCTQGLARRTTMYGGSCIVAWRMRPSTRGAVPPPLEEERGLVHPIMWDNVVPVPMPAMPNWERSPWLPEGR